VEFLEICNIYIKHTNMLGLCKYRNIFGVVGKGVHSYRIFNIAIFDVLLAFILAIVIYVIAQNEGNTWVKQYVTLPTAIIIVFLLSIFSHRLFCVNTTIDKLLFSR
jgi:steroid 5-alpha reductase family enzyme